MAAAFELSGTTLSGKRAGTKWSVLEQFTPVDDQSPGQFSVGYKVRSDRGINAFMKATDLGLLTEEGPSVFERLQAAISAHGFERQILAHCNGSNMDRVVVALDYGETLHMQNGTKEPIFFLVFELAQSDVRIQIDTQKRLDLIWQLGALHDLATAIQQLHRGQVSHNDIKPANFLMFDGDLQKLADLGCATSPLIQAAHDDRHCAGDPRFAAPEVLYATTDSHRANLCSFDSRRVSDLFNLGSMICFMITGRMVTPEVLANLSPEHRPPREDGSGWTGTFVDVLPYWREAFGKTFPIIENGLPRGPDRELLGASQRLVTAIRQLCEPDPALRGHPHDRQGSHDRLSVERFISLFDLLRKDLVVRQ